MNRGPQNLRDTPSPPTVVASLLATGPDLSVNKRIGTGWAISHIGYKFTDLVSSIHLEGDGELLNVAKLLMIMSIDSHLHRNYFDASFE